MTWRNRHGPPHSPFPAVPAAWRTRRRGRSWTGLAPPGVPRSSSAPPHRVPEQRRRGSAWPPRPPPPRGSWRSRR
uniref:Uncharacterized protein n=1 Tax=Arundo donax TaxID=35708 RepID=A0A0A9DW67_ARUDO